MSADDGEMPTPEQVAHSLNISLDTVYRWARDGDLPSLKVARACRTPKSEVVAVMNRQEDNGSHVSYELRADRLSDEMTDPPKRRRAALRDLAQGMHSRGRDLEDPANAIDGLLGEAGRPVPHALLQRRSGRGPMRDADQASSKLRMPGHEEHGKGFNAFRVYLV